MKLTTYLFLLIGFNQLYSQNVSLGQLTEWQKTNYKIVENELLKIGWEKGKTEKSEDIYRNDKYFLNKGSENEKVLTLMYRTDYKLENNSLSYNAVKSYDYDNFIESLKSSGYKKFKSKNGNVISDYYRSDKLTVITSVLKGIDEFKFITIYLCTNEEYPKSHRE